MSRIFKGNIIIISMAFLFMISPLILEILGLKHAHWLLYFTPFPAIFIGAVLLLIYNSLAEKENFSSTLVLSLMAVFMVIFSALFNVWLYY